MPVLNCIETISTPQLKIIPRNNCGKKVILFIKGYKITNGTLNKPNTIELKLNSRRMKKLITNNIINNNIASVIEIFYDAKGLNLVRVTF